MDPQPAKLFANSKPFYRNSRGNVAFLKQSGQELAVSVSSQKDCLFHSWGPDRQLLENSARPVPAVIDRPPIERLFGGGGGGSVICPSATKPKQVDKMSHGHSVHLTQCRAFWSRSAMYSTFATVGTERFWPTQERR